MRARFGLVIGLLCAFAMGASVAADTPKTPSQLICEGETVLASNDDRPWRGLCVIACEAQRAACVVRCAGLSGCAHLCERQYRHCVHKCH